jgi:hypothetical protein
LARERKQQRTLDERLSVICSSENVSGGAVALCACGPSAASSAAREGQVCSVDCARRRALREGRALRAAVRTR